MFHETSKLNTAVLAMRRGIHLHDHVGLNLSQTIVRLPDPLKIKTCRHPFIKGRWRPLGNGKVAVLRLQAVLFGTTPPSLCRLEERLMAIFTQCSLGGVPNTGAVTIRQNW